MIFNSFEYALFLPLVFYCYWLILKDNIRGQNLMLLVVSYIFYGWWDYRFLSLIIISSFIDYRVGLGLKKTRSDKKRKLLLSISLCANLGILGFFKYYNFFVESFIASFTLFGFNLHANTLSIILPVGISFYTFQTLSYTIDVYRRKVLATNNWITFFAYVSFFPQLVAGPIERAKNLLPQFEKNRIFDLQKAKDGLRQILLGLVKKVVVADNCAIAVNAIFEDPSAHNSPTLILGAILFAFQIYCDFSGYSDIAIGSARLLGFDLMKNFNYPYFARDIAEFWRRWHISLSTWFRDYLYIPLGGSRVNSNFTLFRNVMIIFLVSGFWHGASWTFIFWGLLHALFFIPLIFFKLNRKNLNNVAENSFFPTIKELLGMVTTFLLVCFAWIFFRAETISGGIDYIINIVEWNGFRPYYASYTYYILPLVIFEWIQRHRRHALEIKNWNKSVRWSTYYLLVFILLYYKPSVNNDFIYFQF